MRKKISVVVFIISLVALAGMPALAEETMSPAKKKLLEKTKKESVPAATPAAETGKARTDLVDLNKATKQQLMTLPGIGEAEADKIIAARPYVSKMQLRKKEIIPLATFYGITDKVKVDISIKVWEPPPPAAPGKKKEENAEKKDKPKKDMFKDFGK